MRYLELHYIHKLCFRQSQFMFKVILISLVDFLDQVRDRMPL